jgi:hypothetical protein
MSEYFPDNKSVVEKGFILFKKFLGKSFIQTQWEILLREKVSSKRITVCHPCTI